MFMKLIFDVFIVGDSALYSVEFKVIWVKIFKLGIYYIEEYVSDPLQNLKGCLMVKFIYFHQVQ